MSNVISFASSGDYGGITPSVDGVPLTDLIERFERDHGFEPVGGYDGLVPAHFNFGPLVEYFLGRSNTAYIGNTPGRIWVLGCRCGEVGCWPLECLVTVKPDVIVWQNFGQPHRRDRDYSSFGPFAFQTSQYEEALRTLPA